MTVEVHLDDKKIDEFLKEVMQNYPEYSYGNSLECLKYKYDECYYTFLDQETGENYTVNIDHLREGFKIFCNLVLSGALIVFRDPMVVLNLDGGDYDAGSLDALVQCAIFGEVIYG